MLLSQAEHESCLNSLQGEGNFAPSPELTDSTNSQDKGDQILTSAWGRRRNLLLPPAMSLGDRCNVLGLENDTEESNRQVPGKANLSIQPSTPIRIDAPRTGGE